MIYTALPLTFELPSAKALVMLLQGHSIGSRARKDDSSEISQQNLAFSGWFLGLHFVGFLYSLCNIQATNLRVRGVQKTAKKKTVHE